MKKKILIILTFIGSFLVFKFFGLEQYLTLDYIKQNQDLFQNFYQQNQFLTILCFFVVYVLTTALSITGATVLTLLG